MTSSPKFPKLFQPGQIGKVKIKNRIVMAPMGTTFWGVNGEVTDRIIDFYAARAKGGAGLITLGFASVSYPPYYQMVASLDSDRMVPGHNRLVERLHAYGAKVSLQINHAGRAGAYKPGLELVSSSPVRCVRLGELYPTPRALDKSEIYKVIDLFAAIAARAKLAGYDMVEIHGAHGYLVNSFMSSYLNIREDEFGGSLENRLRFPIEIIKRIKAVTGDDYPVGIRINGDEFLEGGTTIQESPIMARMLEEAGAAFIHVASGMDEVKHKQIDIMRLPEGWKAYMWEAIKKAVRIPTFAAGGNRTPEFCERIIAEGKADFMALARQFLADEEWPNKAREGRVDDIRKCTSCMECLGFRVGRAANTVCAVNVAMGREREYGEVRPAQVGRKVMVIGAGPGGMEAARVAALRGHEVTLYDKRGEIGGQLLLAATPPGKEKLLWFRDYQAAQLSKLGVRLKLGVEVTPELVEKSQPESVIIATGSEPVVPEIPGVRNKKVLTAWEVLEGKKAIKNQKVVVAGGGIVGAETAELLVEHGNTVTIVEMLPRIADDMEVLNRKGLIDALEAKQVTMLTEHEVTEISDNGLVVFDKKKGEKKVIEGDWIVLAMGSKPVTELAEALSGKVSQVFMVGDCQQPRTVLAAVYEGACAAHQL